MHIWAGALPWINELILSKQKHNLVFVTKHSDRLQYNLPAMTMRRLFLMMMIIPKQIRSVLLLRGSSRGIRWELDCYQGQSKLSCITSLHFFSLYVFHAAGANTHPMRHILSGLALLFFFSFVTRSARRRWAVSRVHHCWTTRHGHAQSMLLPRVMPVPWVLSQHLLPDSLAGAPTTKIGSMPRRRHIITRAVKVSYAKLLILHL